MLTTSKKTLVLLTLFLSSSAFAASNTDWWQDIEFSAAAGQSWMQAGNAPLAITPSHTDEDAVTHVANQPVWKVGVGYSLFKEELSQRTFFNEFLVELNLYRSNGTLTGEVWAGQDPNYSYYTFRAPVTSTRLMIDLKPSLFTWRGISPYPIVGMGVAWNHMAYYETPTSDLSQDSFYTLGGNTTRNFAAEFGLGVRAKINPHLSASLEYLYANMGNATPSGSSDTFVSPSTPATFTITEQNLLLGLSWTLA